MKELVRIANADIDGKKQMHVALAKVKGIGFSFANAICQILSIDKRKKIGELTDEEIQTIEQEIKTLEKIPSWMYNRRRDQESGKDRHLVSADLKLQQEFDIRLMKKLKTYKGMRHSAGQPVRGQKTKSHFRTGASVGVQKKKMQQAQAKSGGKE